MNVHNRKLDKNSKRIFEFFLLHGKAKSRNEIASLTPNRSRTMALINDWIKKRLIIQDVDGNFILNKELFLQKGYDLEPLISRAEEEKQKLPDIDLAKDNPDLFMPSDDFMNEVTQKQQAYIEYIKKKKQSIPRK